MIASLPRFRTDLTVSRQTSPADGAIFVIKDPVRQQFYRLPEEAHFIAEQLDGETPLDVVRQRVEEKFQTPLPTAQLDAFIRQLDKSGLLESERNARASRRRRRIQGSLLYLRIRFFDPDRLFNALIGKIRFFFTPAFVAVSAAAILAAVCVVVFDWSDIARNFSRVYVPSAIPLIFAAVFCVISAHEFAHGLTCKHFGGEVHELGFFLVYFQPAFYCNVSDAWLFPEKSRRLWVGFAGPYFELFLWALAALLWRATDVETWPNRVAFIVMTTSGVKTLLNFNPLIKLDGYYLLSDWLGIPNLRKRAFASAGEGIKKLFGGGGRRLAEMPARERRILLTYGLVATVSSVALLIFAFMKVGKYFAGQNQLLAFVLFGVMLGLKVRRRFNKLFGKSAKAALADDDAPDETNGADALEEPPRQAARPGKKMPRRRKRLVLFAACAAALAMLGFYNGRLRVGGAFNAMPIRNADVRAGVDGLVNEIHVSEGGMVHQGDLIAQLSDLDNVAQLRQTEADIQEAQAKLELLVNGPRPEEIEAARNEVVKSDESVKFAASTFARDKLLLDAKLISQQDFEASQATLAEQKATLAEDKCKLDLLLAGSRPEDIDATRAQIAHLQAQRSFLQDQIRLAKITSPADGVVATPQRQLHEMRGVFVKKGDLIAKIYDLDTITVEIPVSEMDIAEVKVGQPVVLKARAWPHKTFNGKVTSIAVATPANSTSNPEARTTVTSGPAATPTTFLVTTEVDNRSLLLKPGMTGQAKIICGRRHLFELASRQIAQTFKVTLWSWW